MKQLIKILRKEIFGLEDTNFMKADCKRNLSESLKMVLNTVKRETLMDKEWIEWESDTSFK